MEESDLALAISWATAAVSSTTDSTIEPIRNPVAYKTLAETATDTLDNSGTVKHAGFEEEAWRARRQMRLVKADKEGRIKARMLVNCKYAVFLDTPTDVPRLTRLIPEPRTVSAAREAKCKVSKLQKSISGFGEPGRVTASHGHVHGRVLRWERDCADAASREDAESEFSMEGFERKLIVSEILGAYIPTDD